MKYTTETFGLRGLYRPLSEFTKKKMLKKKECEDVIFEIELIRQVEINIDYILMLVAKYHESNLKIKNILVTIDKQLFKHAAS